MPRKTYSEDFITYALDTLRLKRGNLLETSKVTGVQRATLRAWAAGKIPNHAKAAVIDQRLSTSRSSSIADQLEEMTPEILAAAREKIPSASFKDLLIGAETAISTTQLLRGGPTRRQETNIKVSLVAPDGRSYAGLREAAQAAIDVPFTVHKELGPPA